MATRQKDLEKHNNEKASEARFIVTRSYKKIIDQEVNPRIVCLEIETFKQLSEGFFYDLNALLAKHTR